MHSDLNIHGLKTETYFDSKKNTAYAIAYAKKSDISEYYKNALNNNKLILLNKIKGAEKCITAGDKQIALKSFFECLPVIREIEKNQSLMITMGCHDEKILCIEEITNNKIRIEKGIEGLKSHKQLTLSDICYYMASALKSQARDLNTPIMLSNFTYQDTHIGSSFSRRLYDVFNKRKK